MTLTQDLLKPTAEHLPLLCSLFGLLLLALGTPALIRADATATAWRAYPRSTWPGRILSLIALIWSGLWLMVMPLGPLMFLRHYMVLLVIVAIAAVWFLCDDLLSCRSIGGLLVLTPTLLLSSAQWHPSLLRYIPLTIAYLFAISGMFVIAKPYLLRDLLFWCAQTPARTRLGGSALALLGLLLLLAALG